MGSKTFDGVKFFAYSDDHLPAHVHAFYAETEVLLDLHFAESEEGREIRLADREDNVRPRKAKRSDVRKIRRTAVTFSDELFTLWEEARDEQSESDDLG